METKNFGIKFGRAEDYETNITELKEFLREHPVLNFVETLSGLGNGLSSVTVSHKPLEQAAEFDTPDKIFVDFNNNTKYLALSVAHEYTHLLLRSGEVGLRYALEQNLAILIQLSYEDYAGINEFSDKRAKRLMELMDVVEEGQLLLKNWRTYWRGGLKVNRKQYKNIIDFIGSIKKEI